jgi:epoxyqueuosine reductase
VNACEFSAAVKRQARTLGFSDCRITSIGEAPHAAFFEAWLAKERAGEMQYLERNVEKRRNPALLAEDGQPPFTSLIVLGVDYHQYDLPPEVRDDPSRGIVASYAWGDDYHEVIRPLLYELDAFVRSISGRSTLGKCLVDTGPVLERDWALAAGLGFTGKNCCTIVPGQGSWRFLAVVLVPEMLTPDLPLAALTGQVGMQRHPATCGQCTRCLEACPTQAFTGAYDLNPQRCISYWTIEATGDIPVELRPLFGNRIFGCDICQEVCPYNRRLDERTPLLAALHAQLPRVAPYLLEGFAPDKPYWLDDCAFSEHFARSPIKRAKRQGMLRNVCVALGNWAASDTLPALRLAIGDPQPTPRRHAAWALGRILAKHPHSAIATCATEVLAAAAATEVDESVHAEIATALAQNARIG